VPVALLVLTPVFLLVSPLFVWYLRKLETSDPEVVPPVEPAHATALFEIEDWNVTNQFSAIGSLKPGLFRRWLSIVILYIVGYATRQITLRGKLGRVLTIHTAQWVFLDDKRRVFFGSNYDGELESYMDDFINKVGWGLNLIFSNGIGYPTSNWLVFGGAKNEQKFKNYIRRHQLRTEVWYDAHAGSTCYQIDRQHRVRVGVETPAPSDADARAWCRLL